MSIVDVIETSLTETFGMHDIRAGPLETKVSNKYKFLGRAPPAYVIGLKLII